MIFFYIRSLLDRNLNNKYCINEGSRSPLKFKLTTASTLNISNMKINVVPETKTQFSYSKPHFINVYWFFSDTVFSLNNNINTVTASDTCNTNVLWLISNIFETFKLHEFRLVSGRWSWADTTPSRVGCRRLPSTSQLSTKYKD